MAIWVVRITIIPLVPEPIVIQNEAASIILTAGLIVTTMNAFNFIDGLDGLAAGVAIIGGAASSSRPTGSTGPPSCWTVRTWPPS